MLLKFIRSREKDFNYSLYYLNKAHETFLKRYHDPRRLYEVRLKKANIFINLGDSNKARVYLKGAQYSDASSLSRIGSLRLKFIESLGGAEIPKRQDSIEYKLLEIISKKPVTRDELKDHLWPNHKEMISESIDERLRSVVYRLKKRFNINLQKIGDSYAIGI